MILSIHQVAGVLLGNDYIGDKENVSDHCPLLLAFYGELSFRTVPSTNLDTIDAECPPRSWIPITPANDETWRSNVLLRLHGTAKIKYYQNIRGYKFIEIYNDNKTICMYM